MNGHLPTLILGAIACSAFSSSSWAAVQGIDPPVDGSFVEFLDQSITLSDGYITLADVRYPDVAPGANGWPVILLVHPSGKSRATVAYRATELAKRGYFTVAYDVRGQGPAMALNDPLVYGRGALGVRERVDLAEVLESMESSYPLLIDMGRVGVTGKSQGAVHAWFAAAHSGKLLPTNPWRSIPFPEIHAAVPINFVPQLNEAVLPRGETMSELFARDLYEQGNGIHHEPNFFALVDGLIRAEDFQGLVQSFADPGLHLPTLLEQSTTAVFASLVYDDKYMPVNALVDSWQDILPQAPKALNVATTGHNTPINRLENLRTELRRQDWFDFHLKGIENGAGEWQPIRLAVQPPEAADYASETSVWDAREFDSFPIASATTETWYFHRNSLETSPFTVQRQRTLNQRVSFQNGIDDYLNFLPTPENLQLDLPLDSMSWRSFPLTGDRLMMGEAVAYVHVDTDADAFQVQAALFESPGGRYVTSGFVTVRQPGGFEGELAIPLAFQSYLWREGKRLELRIENLGWHRPPNPNSPTVLRGLPVFENFDVIVRSGGVTNSRLELPLVPFGPPSLLPSELALRSYHPVDFYLDLRADESREAWSYELLVSSSGTEPGHIVDGVQVPLNRDWLTDRVELNPGSLPIAGFAGTLDAAGHARAWMNLSNLTNIPASVPQLDFVVLLRGPSGELEVGGPIRMNVIR